MNTADSNRNMTVQLEDATEADLEQILLLQKRAFSGQAKIYHDPNLPSLTQTLDDLRKEFTGKAFYKVVRNGTIVASIRCCIRDRALSIEKLIVDPDLQNRGIGTAVMGALESRYEETWTGTFCQRATRAPATCISTGNWDTKRRDENR